MHFHLEATDTVRCNSSRRISQVTRQLLKWSPLVRIPSSNNIRQWFEVTRLFPWLMYTADLSIDRYCTSITSADNAPAMCTDSNHLTVSSELQAYVNILKWPNRWRIIMNDDNAADNVHNIRRAIAKIQCLHASIGKGKSRFSIWMKTICTIRRL